MKKTSKIKKIFDSMKNSLDRFPFTIGISIACSVLGIISVAGENDDIALWLMPLILAVPLSMGLTLVFENFKDMRKEVKGIILLLAFGFIMFYKIVYLKDTEGMNFFRYTGTFFVFFAGGFIAACWKNRDIISVYVLRVLNRLFTTILYAIVLFAGMSGILFTIDNLLKIRVDSKLYVYVWILVVGVFSVAFFLGGIPRNCDEVKENGVTKFIKILLVNIVSPMLVIYTVILYIYFVKLVFIMEWPEVMVSHLVLWYAFISLVVIFFITKIKDTTNWIKYIFKGLPIAVIPLLGLMFYSMGIRISAYGITENRYYVVIFGVWILYSMVSFVLGKGRDNIFVACALLGVILFSVYGPLKAESVGKWSQSKQFEMVMKKYNMLEGDQIVKSKETVTLEDRETVRSILRYFAYEHEIEELRFLPENFELNDTEKVFGFDIYEPYKEDINQEYFNAESKHNTVEISGYNVMSRYNYGRGEIIRVQGEYKIVLKDSVIRIYKNNEFIYEKNIEEHFINIYSTHKSDKRTVNLANDEIDFHDENDKVKVKFLIDRISGTIIEEETGEISSLDFILLIGEK